MASANFTFTQRQYWIVLGMICVFAFITRIIRIEQVSNYIFDEVYHVVTAKLIHRNDPRAFEWWNPPIEPNTAVDWLHPPLAKYTQALGMSVFGETPLGWRISAVLFGVGVVFLTAQLALQLFHDHRLALLAALLASLDGLLLVLSRIAMNDIHVTFFLLLTFWCYLRYKDAQYVRKKTPTWLLFFTGFTAGLALGTKWSGLFGLLLVWVFELPHLINTYLVGGEKGGYARATVTWQPFVKEFMLRAIFIGALPLVIYVFSYLHMFLQGKTLVCDGAGLQQGACYCNQTASPEMWIAGALTGINATPEQQARIGCKHLISHFAELHNQIIWYQTTLKATHGYQSRPIQWFFNLRPVWFYVQYGTGTIANIYAQANPTLTIVGNLSIFATLFFLAGTLITSQRGSIQRPQIDKFLALQSPLSRLAFLAIVFFGVWLPWQLSPRIMFFYHYAPAVPLLSIVTAYWMLKIATRSKEGVVIAGGLVTLIAITFAVFYPNWTALPVSQQFADAVYFVLKSWK